MLLCDERLSAIIPQGNDAFAIFYDAEYLGCQHFDFSLSIEITSSRIIKLKETASHRHTENVILEFAWHSTSWSRVVQIGRPLTIDDFEVVKNPYYLEKK
jgi:hypothetical protein